MIDRKGIYYHYEYFGADGKMEIVPDDKKNDIPSDIPEDEIIFIPEGQALTPPFADDENPLQLTYAKIEHDHKGDIKYYGLPARKKRGLTYSEIHPNDKKYHHH